MQCILVSGCYWWFFSRCLEIYSQIIPMIHTLIVLVSQPYTMNLWLSVSIELVYSISVKNPSVLSFERLAQKGNCVSSINYNGMKQAKRGIIYIWNYKSQDESLGNGDLGGREITIWFKFSFIEDNISSLKKSSALDCDQNKTIGCRLKS